MTGKPRDGRYDKGLVAADVVQVAERDREVDLFLFLRGTRQSRNTRRHVDRVTVAWYRGDAIFMMLKFGNVRKRTPRRGPGPCPRSRSGGPPSTIAAGASFLPVFPKKRSGTCSTGTAGRRASTARPLACPVWISLAAASTPSRGPNGRKIEKETTHVHQSWRRLV